MAFFREGISCLLLIVLFDASFGKQVLKYISLKKTAIILLLFISGKLYITNMHPK